MNNKSKKLLSLLLALIMIICIVPVTTTTTYAASSKPYKVVVKAKLNYSNVGTFYNGKAMVENEWGYKGVINSSGKSLIPCKYISLEWTLDDKYILAQDEKEYYYLLNAAGKVLYSYGKHSSISDMGDNLFIVSDWVETVDDFYSESTVIRINGTKVNASAVYSYLYRLINGNYSAMDKDGNSYLLDKNLNVIKKYDKNQYVDYLLNGNIVSYTFNEKDYTSTCSVLKSDGTVLIKAGLYSEIYLLQDLKHYLALGKNDIYYLLDAKGSRVKSFSKYNAVYENIDGNLDVEIYTPNGESKCGIIDLNGKVVIPCKYSSLLSINEGKYYLAKTIKGYYYMLDKTGKVLRSYGKNEYMTDLGDGLLKVTDKNDKIKIISYDGKEIIAKGKIEDVSYYNEGCLPVCVKGKWGIYKAVGVKKTLNTPPKATKISSLKKGKNKVSLKIKKVNGAKGYLVQYSTSKKFKKVTSVYTKKTKLTIKKLKSGKKYYFRVKAYKKNGSAKVLSLSWSKTKNTKVK